MAETILSSIRARVVTHVSFSGVNRPVIARSVSDEAIQTSSLTLDCFASLAMTTELIPARRGLDESAIVRRADQDLVHAHPRWHAGDKGDGAAEIFRLQHF